MPLVILMNFDILSDSEVSIQNTDNRPLNIEY